MVGKAHMNRELKDLRTMKQPWYRALDTPPHLKFEVIVIADVYVSTISLTLSTGRLCCLV